MRSRRVFLKNSAFAMFGMGVAPAWLSRAVFADDLTAKRRKILIVIFQRGAVDGLNVVIPHAEPAYYALRPNIAIPRPSTNADSAIDLDGHFALHPALRPLKALWDTKQLAIVHAVGSPDPTRSHFDAQDYMESGMPGWKGAADGWLNRSLRPQGGASPLRAVSVSPDLPRSLQGKNQALAIGSLADFRVRETAAANSFENMYAGTADQILNGTARQTFDAIKLLESLERGPYTPSNGASYPQGRLGRSLSQIARLIKAQVGLEVAFTDVGGWDTHVNETGAQPHVGHLANLLREFGEALGAFSQDMGDRMADITLVSMSEFGRTVKENGNRGTDHGHANMMFVLGGDVRGQRVYGRWPGLEREQLFEARDLNVTTDFRSVLGEIVDKQMSANLAAVFPRFGGSDQLGLLAASS